MRPSRLTFCHVSTSCPDYCSYLDVSATSHTVLTYLIQLVTSSSPTEQINQKTSLVANGLCTFRTHCTTRLSNRWNKHNSWLPLLINQIPVLYNSEPINQLQNKFYLRLCNRPCSICLQTLRPSDQVNGKLCLPSDPSIQLSIRPRNRILFGGLLIITEGHAIEATRKARNNATGMRPSGQCANGKTPSQWTHTTRHHSAVIVLLQGVML